MSLFQPVKTDLGLDRGWRGRLPHAVALIFVATVYAGGLLDWLEYKLMDGRFTLDQHPSSNTVIHVGMDSSSIRELQQWPWPRRFHADVVNRLVAAGAARVMLDIDVSSASTAVDDAALAEAIRNANGKVLLPVFKQFADGTIVHTEPLDLFREHAQTASVTVQPDRDSLLRRYNPAEPWRGGFIPSAAVQLAGTLPDTFEPFYIDFSIRPESIRHFSYVDVLRGRFPPASVRDKTVVVGATAVELGDMLAVPIHGALSGSMLQILAYESLVMGRAIQRTPVAVSLVVALLLALFLGPMLSAMSWQRGLGVTLGVGLLIYGGAALLQAKAPVSADISPLLLVLLLSFAWSLIRRIDLQAIRLFKQHMAAVHRQALVESVVADSFDGIIITNADGRVDLVNPTASSMLGVDQKQVLGENILRYLPPEVIDHNKAVLQDSATDIHVLVRSRPLEIVSRRGARIPVNYSVTRAALAPGKNKLERRVNIRSAYIYTFRDMRDTLKAQSALQIAAEKAIAADRAKSEMVANVSHELRTPLNAIIGFSNVMCMEMFGPLGHDKYKSYAEDIQGSGEHLLDLVNNLLTASKLESEGYELNEEYLVLPELVDRAWLMVGANARADQVVFESVVSENLPRLYGDANGILQILVNLVGNAVKFTPRGGRVRVLLAKDVDGCLTISVADDGIGIDESHLSKVTDPFHQVEVAMHREYGGAGLGLHIVANLVGLHGAKMHIESELGVGTRITVTFPKARAEKPDNVIVLRESANKPGDT